MLPVFRSVCLFFCFSFLFCGDCMLLFSAAAWSSASLTTVRTTTTRSLYRSRIPYCLYNKRPVNGNTIVMTAAASIPSDAMTTTTPPIHEQPNDTAEDKVRAAESPSVVAASFGMPPASVNGASSSSPTTTTNVRAVRTSDVAACARRLGQGRLVAFPTETVYGLGAHALDQRAVLSIFAAKERPLTDPLIVHVLHASQAYELWNATASPSSSPSAGDDEPPSTEAAILRALCERFWPGPLTLVASAAAAESDTAINILTAGTGCVACRSPSDKIARQLLAASRLPLAAPSANKFGHVSPTTADHVWNDLCQEDVWILEEEEGEQEKMSGCEVGVESTVAKVEHTAERGHVVTVLRQGAVCVNAIRECLREANLGGDQVTVQSNLDTATADHIPNVSPGQTVRHYSPHVPSFLVSETCSARQLDTTTSRRGEPGLTVLRQAVVIDFGRRLVAWKDVALAYRDLSPTGDSQRAAQTVFDTLRWAEQVDGAACILFPQLPSTGGLDALTLAVKDRLTRAASGVVIKQLQDALS